MAKIDYKKYFNLLILSVILYVSFLILKPFIVTVVMSLILAYALYPLYRLLNRKIKRSNLTALLTTVIVIIMLVAPAALLVNAVSREVSVAFITAKQTLATGNLFGGECEGATNIVCKASAAVTEFSKDPQIRFYIDDTLRSGASVITKKLSDFVLSIPRRILDIFIMFFILFYLFRDGKELVRKLSLLLPFKKSHTAQIMKRLNNVMYAVVYVYFLAALVQGFLGGLGFLIFGISNPILWGIVMALFSLLPIGSLVIWGPAGLFLILNGAVQDSNSLILRGILLIVYGIVVVGLADNVLRIKFIGGKAQIHSALIILGVLGGLIAFGFIGTIIGPLVLALLVTIIDIYEQEQ